MNDIQGLESAQAVFYAEAHELLDAMEEGLQVLRDTPDDKEQINALFRAAHTIKGSAGMFDLKPVVAFTHELETLLSKVRDGELHVNDMLDDRLLECHDHLLDLIEREEQGEPLTPELEKKSAELVAGLKAFIPNAGTANPAIAQDASTASAKQAASAAIAAASEAAASGGSATDNWHISLRLNKGVLRDGMDPASFIRYLSTLGKVVDITTLPDSMPEAEHMDPRDCHLGFEIEFNSVASKQEIEGAFEFIRNDCQLRIIPPHSRIQDYVDLIHQLPEPPDRLGQILIAAGILTASELAQALGKQIGADGEINQSLGQVLVQENLVPKAVVDAAVERQGNERAKHASEDHFVRIPASKLDTLIDLVSELVIAGANANLVAMRGKDALMQEAAGAVSQLVDDIRDASLQLRMVHIGETFNRFNRVVREVSKELGKEIQLEIRGAETELDKTVVDKIGDPLMHLVRNAMDHGIEPAEVRKAAGKPVCGHIGLNAYHESGTVVIEVTDDGGGLNRDRILAKAIERGLVQPGQNLSDNEIVNLIFLPGFSTAEKVTNLSGRGVGMDVVSKNIQALRGTVEVASEPGKGSRFTIRLPLTLAIIAGFLVSVGKASYVIPMETVVECRELEAASAGRDYLDLRGHVLPFTRLRELFQLPGQQPPRENVVVVRNGKELSGVVVDQLHGELQAVIKPLSGVFRNLRGISGSTILGSGEVALILDVPGLIRLANQREERRTRASATTNTEREAS